MADGRGGKRKGAGRPKGSTNKTTSLLREAIIFAAEETGVDGEGTDGLVGYCKHLALHEPKAFASLMGRVLPIQVANEDDKPFQTVTRIELVAPSVDG